MARSDDVYFHSVDPALLTADTPSTQSQRNSHESPYQVNAHTGSSQQRLGMDDLQVGLTGNHHSASNAGGVKRGSRSYYVNASGKKVYRRAPRKKGAPTGMPRKRSCRGCTERKQKCSRETECSACRLRGIPCVWDDAVPDRPSPAANVDMLQAEARMLRETVQVLTNCLEEREGAAAVAAILARVGRERDEDDEGHSDDDERAEEEDDDGLSMLPGIPVEQGYESSGSAIDHLPPLLSRAHTVHNAFDEQPRPAGISMSAIENVALSDAKRVADAQNLLLLAHSPVSPDEGAAQVQLDVAQNSRQPSRHGSLDEANADIENRYHHHHQGGQHGSKKANGLGGGHNSRFRKRSLVRTEWFVPEDGELVLYGRVDAKRHQSRWKQAHYEVNELRNAGEDPYAVLRVF